MNYVYLAGAIVAETIGTSALSQAAGFTRPIPTAIVLVSFATSFYLMSLALQTIPVGIAYAIWAGVGIILIALIGFFFLGQRLDAPAYVGIALILVGVVVLRLFSRATVH